MYQDEEPMPRYAVQRMVAARNYGTESIRARMTIGRAKAEGEAYRRSESQRLKSDELYQVSLLEELSEEPVLSGLEGTL